MQNRVQGVEQRKRIGFDCFCLLAWLFKDGNHQQDFTNIKQYYLYPLFAQECGPKSIWTLEPQCVNVSLQ